MIHLKDLTIARAHDAYLETASSRIKIQEAFHATAYHLLPSGKTVFESVPPDLQAIFLEAMKPMDLPPETFQAIGDLENYAIDWSVEQNIQAQEKAALQAMHEEDDDRD